jgi:hypothetical protein
MVYFGPNNVENETNVELKGEKSDWSVVHIRIVHRHKDSQKMMPMQFIRWSQPTDKMSFNNLAMTSCLLVLTCGRGQGGRGGSLQNNKWFLSLSLSPSLLNTELARWRQNKK